MNTTEEVACEIIDKHLGALKHRSNGIPEMGHIGQGYSDETRSLVRSLLRGDGQTVRPTAGNGRGQDRPCVEIKIPKVALEDVKPKQSARKTVRPVANRSQLGWSWVGFGVTVLAFYWLLS